MQALRKPFFEDVQRQQNLYVEARSWVNTPFVAHGRVKGPGGGVDCVHLVSAILAAVGFAHRFDPPPYSVRAGQTSAHSQLIEYIDMHIPADRVSIERMMPHFSGKPIPDTSAIQAGDLLCFSLGRCAHHIGLVFGCGKFIHAMGRRGVLDSYIKDTTYLRRLVAVYRPLE
jgi:cell wall-associated NlpC family hydrolase